MATTSPPSGQRLDQTMSTDQVRARLRQTFAGRDGDKRTYDATWDTLWQDGSFLPWDHDVPNPAFVEALTERGALCGTAWNKPSQHSIPSGKELPPDDQNSNHENQAVATNAPINATRRRRRAFVPGCGTGYDVLLLASRGWDAVGLEISPRAVQVAEAYRDDTVRASDPTYAVPSEVQAQGGRGSATFIVGDFFTPETWLSQMDEKSQEGFDLIYDYTFGCALHPSTRPQWAATHARLLRKDGGRLICLEFPRVKPTNSGGPPFAMPSQVYHAHLSQPGRTLQYEVDGSLSPGQEPENGGSRNVPGFLMRLAHYPFEETFAVSQGTDWISVWGHV